MYECRYAVHKCASDIPIPEIWRPVESGDNVATSHASPQLAIAKKISRFSGNCEAVVGAATEENNSS